MGKILAALLVAADTRPACQAWAADARQEEVEDKNQGVAPHRVVGTSPANLRTGDESELRFLLTG